MSKRFYFDEFSEDIFDEQVEDYISNQEICAILNSQAQRIAELENQLREKEQIYPFMKVYKKGEFISYNVVNETLGIVTTITFGDNKEMAEEYLKSLGGSKTNHNQNKIKFAVDCLNELKDFISNYYSEVIDCDYQAVYSNKIDEMIVELLEENEEN